ncbi:MAG TPA: glycoside hydrolase family 88 protein [Aggregatilinea sp.]|uniref:glycoside hydrolase family 88 protein n=1 Tax=Aggregatilinea sp. TaxID=2806333 RepID=UPI002C1585DF|nr:glycoside hydrolase family 88 protein [Aggregatilinea sp.]HML22898.1 glycoside hydrolase family 88 protein [Aggregatilinea sp.]
MSYADTLAQVFDAIRRTIPRMGTDRPAIGRGDGTYERCHDSHWVDGFWIGQLWLAYAATGDGVFLDAARAQRPYFIARLDRPESHDHDLGFLYSLSLVADYKLTGDETACRGGLRAADGLAARYNPHGGFIQAWNSQGEHDRNRGRMIIDCMENLGLLFWASEQAGDLRYRDVAVAHAITTLDTIVRPDDSTYHSFVFDPDTGERLCGETVQGFADESCWSRGHSWGIHGFALAHQYTGEVRFREAAVRLAAYALAHLPGDGVPYWDYRLPDDAPHYRDSSAAAIMAAGLFLLADQVTDEAQAARYRDAARGMLDALIADYTLLDQPGAEGLLAHGASHVSRGYEDNMLPYGDYFFVEALLRALGRTAFFW